jgi:hypothetical protein
MTGATPALIRARGFVERGWCRGAEARDADGNSVRPRDDRAIAWCAYGALVKAVVPPSMMCAGIGDGHPVYRRFVDAIDGENIGDFNDRQETVQPVLAAFDRAIAFGNVVAAES